MAILITAPLDFAVDRAKRVLFKPFQIGKWFTLGFCAFLAQLGEGGGCNFNLPVGGGGGPGPAMPAPSSPSFEEWSWLIPLMVVAVIMVLAIMVLVIWLKCRGKFMFMDGIVRNSGQVVDPWKYFRVQGNSLFCFNLVFGLASLLSIFLIGGIGVAIAWPDIQAGQLSIYGVVAIILVSLLFLFIMLAALVITFLLEHCVVPAMYLRGQRVMEAWHTVRSEILPGNTGRLILFFLMRLLLNIGIAVATGLLTCLTCFLAALPYLGSVITLPFSVFMQAYTLHFLEQFGPEWSFFVYDDLPLCKYCGYNLTGNTSGICPECGTPIPPDQTIPPPPASA